MNRFVTRFELRIRGLLPVPADKHLLLCRPNSTYAAGLAVLSLVPR